MGIGRGRLEGDILGDKRRKKSQAVYEEIPGGRAALSGKGEGKRGSVSLSLDG